MVLITRRAMKAFICASAIAFSGVAVKGIGDEEIETAVKVATVSLQREMTSLREQLELFEMKHETLQAASEQFRIQSKSAKAKLEEERKRYDILALEKESLEMSIENKLEVALKNQKTTFEETIAAELMEKKRLLAKENEELVQKLRRTELHIQMLEKDWKEKLEDQAKRYELTEGKRSVSEEKLRIEASDLKKRLAYSEKQARSFEESWKNAVKESEAKDEFFQEESGKRLDEASRWEKRLQKLNAESKDLYEDNKAKEIELVRSKKLHLTLLEKLSESDEAVREHEKKILKFTTDIERLSNDLTTTSGELTQSKKERDALSKKFENLSDLHHDTKIMLENATAEGKKAAGKNKQLQNELVDLKFDLDQSQQKTKETIEEKSEMTKAYTEALEQLTSKNTLLRHELVDLKFELEQSQTETDALKTETVEITQAHKNAVVQLESDGRTLKSLQKEYASLKKEFESITEQFEESQEKVKAYEKRITEEAAVNEELQKELLYSELKIENGQKIEQELSAESEEIMKMYEAIQKTMGSSEKQLLETMQQYEKSEAHVEKLQGSVERLEERVEELIDELEMKELKNSFLQKSLLETKFDLEASQNKVNLLEGDMIDGLSSDQDVGTLEVEKRRITQRAQQLELELEESAESFNAASRKIDDLRDQLYATQTRSAEILSMYEEMKEANNVLTRNLELQEKKQLEMGFAEGQSVEKIVEQSEPESVGNDNEIQASPTTEQGIVDSEDISEQESQKQSEESFFSFFRSLDFVLYAILRVVVDSVGYLVKGLWQVLSSSNLFVRLASPFTSFFAVASWAYSEFGVIHDALVSLFEFEMTFISSLVSSEKDRSIFVFLIRHSDMFVMFGEAIAMLLAVDFVVSSFLNPIRAQKRRPRAKTIRVPKSANASLLRKANNM